MDLFRFYSPRTIPFLLVLLLVVLLVFGWIGFTDSSSSMGTTHGRIYIDTPEIYTRERLVNDRFQQDAWLRKQLNRQVEFGVQASVANSTRRETTLGMTVGNESSSGETPAMTSSPTSPPVSTSPVSSSPIERFRDELSYREEIRNELLENQLDDRHDIGGNTLYRLKFDATVVPEHDTSAHAMVEVTIEGADFDLPEAGGSSELDAPWEPLLAYSEFGAEPDERREFLERFIKLSKLRNASAKSFLRLYDDWADRVETELIADATPGQPSADMPDADNTEKSPVNADISGVTVFGIDIDSISEAIEEMVVLVMRRGKLKQLRNATSSEILSQGEELFNYLDMGVDDNNGIYAHPIDPLYFEYFGDKNDLEKHLSLRDEIAKNLYGEAKSCAPGWIGSHPEATNFDLNHDKVWDLLTEIIDPVVATAPSEKWAGACGELYLDIVELLEIESDFPFYCEDLADELKLPDDICRGSMFQPELIDGVLRSAWSWIFETDYGYSDVYGEADKLKLIREVKKSLNALGAEWRDNPLIVTYADEGWGSVEFNVGLADFIIGLHENKARVYTYAVTPKERVQRISRDTRLMQSLGLAAGAAQQGIKGNLTYAAGRSAQANAISRQPLIVGYSPLSKSGSASMGWLIGPRFQIPASVSEDVRFRHVPSQFTLTGIISVPSWWKEFTMSTRTYWLNEVGEVIEFDEVGGEEVSERKLQVELPGDLRSITDALLPEREAPKPKIDEKSFDGAILKACVKGAIIIKGEHLWRSTVVTIGSQQADAITVLPSMDGIIAEFGFVNLPAEPVIENQEIKLDLVVWTSEGEAEQKDSITILGATTEECEKERNAQRLRDGMPSA